MHEPDAAATEAEIYRSFDEDLDASRTVPQGPVWDDDAPRVVAVLVSHDGGLWLNAALDALEAQDYPNLEILAVDNASRDGAREVLIDRLGPDRVIVSDIDMGFGAAVSMALDAAPREIDYVWMLHDDVAFLPDALGHLVAALERAPGTAIVGAKLRDWSDGDRLQAVGWTIDATGRADSGVDVGELDQGQRDQAHPALYVSTAGMLARRQTLDELGRFDRRFHIFRDDLDLCWRAWQADHEVWVIPDAVGAHVNAAADYVRLGQTARLGPRYFAERNTLAALLKNYGGPRVPFVVALYFFVGFAKLMGFAITRRFSDIWQTLRAWAWNVLHLRETWRLRREVQQARVRSDRELKHLFGRVTTRIRAYAEALVFWVTGGDHAPAPADEVTSRAEPGDARSRGLISLFRARPVAVAGLILVTAVMIGSWQLLVPGTIRGGQLANWPASPMAFLGDYVSGWHEGGAFGTSATPSPAQALLGLLHLLAGGSAYLAPRLLLFGAILAGWVFALRAAQQYSPRRIPRVVAATAYVLSPPSLAALATGQVDALIVMAVLPGIVAATVTFADQRSTPSQAWRAVSAAALLAAVGAAFQPWLLAVLIFAGVVGMLAALAAGLAGSWQRTLAVRVFAALAAPLVLLLPWTLDLADLNGPLFSGQGTVASGALWEWLALSPALAGFPGLVAGAGFILAGLLGLAIGVSRVPALVATLWVVAIAGATTAWWLGQTGTIMWPGIPLLLTAAAFAALFALAFASAEAQLGRFGFGWRQIGAAVTAAAVVVSVVAVATDHLRSGLEGYARNAAALPAFIGTQAEQHDFRVLVLADDAGAVSWEVVDGRGPSMTAVGLAPSPALAIVGDAVDDAVSRRDPWAMARLGPLNVRYVVVPAGGESAALDAALRGQYALEPRPVAGGRVYTTVGWLPRAAVVPSVAAQAITEHGRTTTDHEAHVVNKLEPGIYGGVAEQRGWLLLAEPDDGQWVATADGVALDAMVTGASNTVAFGGVAQGAALSLQHLGHETRQFEVGGQLIAVLLVVSLALRPPRFARQRRALPAAEPQLVASKDAS